MSLLLLFKGGPPPPVRLRLREAPPLRQHLKAITPSGKVYRWADDEPEPENVFSGLSYSSSVPGGYKDLSVTLPRKPGIDYSDLERLTTIEVWGTGVKVGEYRLESAPRTSGEQMSVSPNAVGWVAHLEDDASAREIYRDIDLSKWGSPPSLRAQKLSESIYNPQAGSIEVRPGQSVPPVLALEFERITAPPAPIIEAWYDAQGIDLGLISWEVTDYDKGAGGYGTIAAPWSLLVLLATTENTAAFDAPPANLIPAGTPGSGSLTAGAGRKYAVLQYLWPNPTLGDGVWRIEFKHLAVYGKHGLTKRGTEPNAGFYASDVIANAISRWAPKLRATTGASGSIKPTSFVIPQLEFRDAVTPGEIIRQADRFHLGEYGVWNDRTFYYNERGARGRKWQARVGPSQLEETGPQVDRLWNGILVRYQDVDGTTRVVGPPNSGCAITDERLADSDPLNPANVLGIRRWQTIDYNGVAGKAEEPIRVGQRFLEETKLLDGSGKATLTGYVESEAGIRHPYWEVMAGDSIRFLDAADTSYRYIVNVQHDRSGRSCSVDLDAPPQGLDAVLERLQVGLVQMGVG